MILRYTRTWPQLAQKQTTFAGLSCQRQYPGICLAIWLIISDLEAGHHCCNYRLCDCVNTGRGWAVDADSTAGYARECYNGAGPDAACNFQSSGGGSGGYGQIQDEESEGCRFWVYIKIVTSQ